MKTKTIKIRVSDCLQKDLNNLLYKKDISLSKFVQDFIINEVKKNNKKTLLLNAVNDLEEMANNVDFRLDTLGDNLSINYIKDQIESDNLSIKEGLQKIKQINKMINNCSDTSVSEDNELDSSVLEFDSFKKELNTIFEKKDNSRVEEVFGHSSNCKQGKS